jgi:hypothetical protein
LEVDGNMMVKKLAVSCNSGVDDCCSGDLGDSSFLQVVQGQTLTEVDHYLDDPSLDYLAAWRGQRWLEGLRGLKDIYFFVASRLYWVQPGRVGPYVGFRPASSNGFNEDQQLYREKIEVDIDRVDSGDGVHWTFETPWVGDNKPNFHFVSFCPRGVPGTVCEALAVDCQACDSLSRGNWAFIRRQQRIFGVTIDVTKRYYQDADQQEIGISGLKQKVELAKQAIKHEVEKGLGRCIETNNDGTIYRQYEDCHDRYRESTKDLLWPTPADASSRKN